jgi:hypothetical protein
MLEREEHLSSRSCSYKLQCIYIDHTLYTGKISPKIGFF